MMHLRSSIFLCPFLSFALSFLTAGNARQVNVPFGRTSPSIFIELFIPPICVRRVSLQISDLRCVCITCGQMYKEYTQALWSCIYGECPGLIGVVFYHRASILFERKVLEMERNDPERSRQHLNVQMYRMLMKLSPSGYRSLWCMHEKKII